MSKEFVAVAEEAYYLYPENPAHVERAMQREDHRFFRSFGEQMPRADWNANGTKQGIYMMGPNAEYLEGKFAASGEPDDIRKRLSRALEKWEEIRRVKAYANKPIPSKPWSPPPGVEGELVLRVNLRDLPRGPDDKSGARRHELQNASLWRDFVKWAWNENWIAVPRVADLIPKSDELETVDASLVRKMAREVLVDNVRGQAPQWTDNEVKAANVTMRKLSENRIEYIGHVSMESGSRSFDGKLYGLAHHSGKAFTSFDWVIIGTRKGAARFNQRENDPGPAPMGMTLSMRRQ